MEETKKWPVLASIFLALWIVGAALGALGALMAGNFIVMAFAIAALIVVWNLYKFKPWALTGLNIIVVINILLSLYELSSGSTSAVQVAFRIGLNILVVIYFNSPKLKSLLNR